jgi:hypothetical protein
MDRVSRCTDSSVAVLLTSTKRSLKDIPVPDVTSLAKAARHVRALCCAAADTANHGERIGKLSALRPRLQTPDSNCFFTGTEERLEQNLLRASLDYLLGRR